MKWLIGFVASGIVTIFWTTVFELNKEYFLSLANALTERFYFFVSSHFVQEFIGAWWFVPNWAWWFFIFQVFFTYVVYLVEEEVKKGNESAIVWAERMRLAVVNPESEYYALKK